MFVNRLEKCGRQPDFGLPKEFFILFQSNRHSLQQGDEGDHQTTESSAVIDAIDKESFRYEGI